jgi:acyl-CoA thioesterase-2
VDDPFEALLAVLDLRAAVGSTGNRAVFTGASQQTLHGRVFGGQVLGQALVAASRTVDPERPAHSMHAYFLRPGDPGQQITFTVEVLRDGRSFSARRVQAAQAGAAILSMIASFQVVEDGYDHAVAMPDVPGPEDLPTTAELLADVDHPAARYWSHQRPIDVRHVGSAVYLGVDEAASTQAVWLRAAGTLPDDEALHRAVTAYASDYTMLEPVLRRHGLAWSTPGLRAASLDHAMWWHRPVRADQWLLFTQTSPSASGARGLSQGHFFAQDGSLVATVAQEGMLRVPQG